MTTFRGDDLAACGNTLRLRSEAGGAECDAVDHDRPGPGIPAAEPFREGQLGRDRIGEPVVKKAKRLRDWTAAGRMPRRLHDGVGSPEARVGPVARVRLASVAINPGPPSVPARRTT